MKTTADLIREAREQRDAALARDVQTHPELSYNQIAVLHGVTKDAVMNAARRHGVLRTRNEKARL